MPAPANLLGRRFGRLRVVRRMTTDRPGRWWLVVCDCKTEQVVPSEHLLRKRRPKQSCGCLQREAASAEMTANNKRPLPGERRRCFGCGKMYLAGGPNQKYHSRACFLAHHRRQST